MSLDEISCFPEIFDILQKMSDMTVYSKHEIITQFHPLKIVAEMIVYYFLIWKVYLTKETTISKNDDLILELIQKI